MEISDFGEKVEQEKDKNALYDSIDKVFHINRSEFIGCHPISLTLENIPLLLSEDYFVCEKSDGVRAILVITNKKYYWYDRKNEFYKLTLEGVSDDRLYIFDGELFYEGDCLMYGIFDCLVYEDISIMEKNLSKRLFYCEEFVKKIMSDEQDRKKRQEGHTDRTRQYHPSYDSSVHTHSTSNMTLYVKKMYKSYGFLEIYKEIPFLKHKNDGLIFTPIYAPYPLGRRASILKWKPPSINTVDFKIERVYKDVYALKCTYNNKKDILFDYYTPKIGGDGGEEDYDGKIGEFGYQKEGFTYDFENLRLKRGRWVFYKIRKDKETANHIRVVESIFSSLEENLDIVELSKYYKPMRDNFKIRETKGR